MEPIKRLEDIELTPEQRRNIEKAKDDLEKERRKGLVQEFKENVRNNPLLQNEGIIAVSKNRYTFFKVFTVLLFIVIMLGLVFLVSGAYNGNFKSVFNATLDCGVINLTCEKQECNPQLQSPSIPDYTCRCPDITINMINNTVYVNTTNST